MMDADAGNSSAPSADEIGAQLSKILAGDAFKGAHRSSALLRYLVEQSLAGKSDAIKEYALGVDVLGRGSSFDPRTDPIARVEASRLRQKLDAYYGGAGATDSIIIALPKGGYVPSFERRSIGNGREVAPRSGSHRVSAFAPWAIAIVATFVALFAWTYRDTAPSKSSSLTGAQRFEVELNTAGRLGSQVGNDFALSRDGERIAFVSLSDDGRYRLYTRRLDQSQAMQLADSDGARQPFFSPDGRWIGFWADNKLKKISVDGGSPMILCVAEDMGGASWSEDGGIVLALAPNLPGNKMWRAPAEGGPPKPLFIAQDPTELMTWPQLLPGGRHVIYTSSDGGGADRANIAVHALVGDERKILIKGGTYGRYLASGHLLYVNQGTLYAAPFDVRSLSIVGAAVPVAEDVSYSPLFGYAQFDVSQTGTLVYRRSGENSPVVIDWIDRSGRQSPLMSKPDRYSWPRLSPDGKQLAVTVTASGARSILIHDIESNVTRTLTSLGSEYTGLTWFREGLFFGGRDGIHWIDVDRPEVPKLLRANFVGVPWSMTADGSRLGYYERRPQTGFDVWTVPIELHGDDFAFGEPEPVLRTAAFEFGPEFSPDGRWIAYSSRTNDIDEVFVRRYPDTGYVVKLASDGTRIRWSPTARELFFRNKGQQVMVVSYRIVGDRFIPDPPRPWSTHRLADSGVVNNYDVAPDGERIAALMPNGLPDRQSDNHVTFILNFDELLQKQLSAR